jgi:hypothetical protein
VIDVVRCGCELGVEPPSKPSVYLTGNGPRGVLRRLRSKLDLLAIAAVRPT